MFSISSARTPIASSPSIRLWSPSSARASLTSFAIVTQ